MMKEIKMKKYHSLLLVAIAVLSNAFLYSAESSDETIIYVNNSLVQKAQKSDEQFKYAQQMKRRSEIYEELQGLHTQLRSTQIEDAPFKNYFRVLSSGIGFLAGYTIAHTYMGNEELFWGQKTVRDVFSGTLLGVSFGCASDTLFASFFREKLLPTTYDPTMDPLNLISAAFSEDPQKVEDAASWATKMRMKAVCFGNVFQFSYELSRALAVIQKSRNRAQFVHLEEKTTEWVKKVAMLKVGIRSSFASEADPQEDACAVPFLNVD